MKTKAEYQYILSWHKKIKAINILGDKCQECGEDRIWLLNFHHKNPSEKEFGINDIRGKSWNNLKEEILKCKLLCHNCHRKIHHNDPTFYTENKKVLLEMKMVSGCEICGYNEYVGALDFHHEKDKHFKLCGNKIYEKSCDVIRNRLNEELNKCTVLCANCHQDLHFDKETFNNLKDEIENWDYKEYKIPLDKELVMKLYNEGMKQVDIAKRFERNKSVICGIIQRYRLVV